MDTGGTFTDAAVSIGQEGLQVVRRGPDCGVRQSRRHAARNEVAMFRTPVTSEHVETSRLIFDPLRLFDCSPIADGADAAVISCEPAPGAVRLLARPNCLPTGRDMSTFGSVDEEVADRGTSPSL